MLINKLPWQNQDFQQLMLEIATRWAIANKSKRVKLEF